MNNAFVLLFMIVVVFVILMVVKKKTDWKFCVLCLAVSLTWVSFLLMFWFGFFHDPVVLAVLVGESVFGIYHLLEKKVKEDWYVFRLPALLTLTAFAFFALKVPFTVWAVALLLFFLWLASMILFFNRSRRSVGEIAKKLIACCKDW